MMTGRLDWRKACFVGQPTTSIPDEQNHLDSAFTARWLAVKEKQNAENKRAQKRRKRSVR
jgi:hypothetical protein